MSCWPVPVMSPMAGPVAPITRPTHRCASVAGEANPENLPCNENLLLSSVATTMPWPRMVGPSLPLFGVDIEHQANTARRATGAVELDLIVKSNPFLAVGTEHPSVG